MITTREELRGLEQVREEELSFLNKLEGLLHRAVDLGEDKHIDNYFKAKNNLALLDSLIAQVKEALGLGE